MSFLRDAFSEDGQASSSRLMMAFHAIFGAGWVCHHIYHGHPLADVPWAGLTGFVTAPYGINALKGIAQSASQAFAGAPKP